MYKVTYGNKYVSNTEETKVATGQSDLVTIALDFQTVCKITKQKIELTNQKNLKTNGEKK